MARNIMKKQNKKLEKGANKSWQYKRDLNDWISLCIDCHRDYDSNAKGRVQAIWGLTLKR